MNIFKSEEIAKIFFHKFFWVKYFSVKKIKTFRTIERKIKKEKSNFLLVFVGIFKTFKAKTISLLKNNSKLASFLNMTF